MYVTVVPLLWQEIKRHSAGRLARHFGQSLTELRSWRVNCVIIRWWIDGTLILYANHTQGSQRVAVSSPDHVFFDT